MGVGAGVGVAVAFGVGVAEGVGVGVGDGAGAGLQAESPSAAARQRTNRIRLCRQHVAPLSSPSGNFCGTREGFVVFCPACHGLWLSLVERLNGVQEVPGSNPGSPIFRDLGKLLRSEEVR